MKEAPGYKQPLATWPRFVASSIPEQVKILRKVSSSRKKG